MIDPAKFLEDVSGRFAASYFAAIHDIYVATVRKNRVNLRAAREELARVMAETMGASEVLGAMLALEAVSKTARGAQFASAADQNILPRVTLTEALEDLVERAPMTLKNAAERTAQNIGKLYTQEGAMAFARAAEQTVTVEAQRFVGRMFKQGVDENTAGRRLAMGVEEVRKLTEPWSEGYARMVFRTNVNSSITAGRFRQTQDPDIKAAVPAFRFDSVGDGDTRHNHNAADGIIMAVDDTRWSKIAPPLGYNCRCQISHVSIDELEAMGRIKDGKVVASHIPGNAGPDDGFVHGGRPDLI